MSEIRITVEVVDNDVVQSVRRTYSEQDRSAEDYGFIVIDMLETIKHV